MADDHSDRLRFRLLEVNANDGTWGTELNENVIAMIDEAIAGIHSEAVTAGNVTLSTNFGESDGARNAMIILTGSPGTTRTVTFPDVEKLTWILNNTSDGSSVVLTAGAGTSVTLKSGYFALVRSDGATNMVRIIQTDLLDVAGIRFPSVQIASSDANTLDDYEEATYTPTLGDGTNNYTLTTAEGTYTKIGRVVIWHAVCVWNSIGSATSSQLRVSIPVTAGSAPTYASAAIGAVSGLDTTATENQLLARVPASAAYCEFVRVNDNAGATSLAANGSSSSGSIAVGGVYFV